MILHTIHSPYGSNEAVFLLFKTHSESLLRLGRRLDEVMFMDHAFRFFHVFFYDIRRDTCHLSGATHFGLAFYFMDT